MLILHQAHPMALSLDAKRNREDFGRVRLFSCSQIFYESYVGLFTHVHTKAAACPLCRRGHHAGAVAAVLVFSAPNSCAGSGHTPLLSLM